MQRERVESSLDGTRNKQHQLMPSRAAPHLEHSLLTNSKEPTEGLQNLAASRTPWKRAENPAGANLTALPKQF